MPQYIMPMNDIEGWRVWNKLTAFEQGYFECALFCGVERKEGDPEGDHSKLDDCAFDDINDETVAEMKEHCAEFQADAKELLAQAYANGYTQEQAGHDLWYTRNGHGVGFWDRRVLERADVGDKLAELCGTFKKHSEYSLFMGDDDKVYGCGG